MNMVISPNLHRATWTRETGPNINKTPATDYTAQNVSCGPSGNALLVHNYSTQDGGADLVTTKVPIPSIPGVSLNYVRLRCLMFIPFASMLNLGRLETDVKICNVKAPTSEKPGPRNISNGSTQINFSEKPPRIQIDLDPPGWKDTPFTPTLPVAQWFSYSHDVYTDPVAKTFSVLGFNIGATRFLNVTMVNVPWQNSNWQALVAAIQLQLMVLKAGTCDVFYDLMELVWSDQPIQ